MSSNEKLEINVKSPSYILFAPKIKLKKATITPTPFILNEDSYEREFELDYDSYNSSDDEEQNKDKNLQNVIRNNITGYTIKIERTVKQWTLK